MKKVIVSESQVKRLVEKMVNEQRPVNQPAAAPQPYTINLQNAFPSGQYEINPQFGKIINDGVMQIQEYVRKNNIKDFKLVITPGESKVPNQTNLETGKPYLPGELATLRAESLKTYLESVIGNTFNVKPIIEVSQPVMGTTPWDGVNKDDPNELAFAWVLDFPMFEKTDEGEIQAVHHPFCSIKDEDKEKFMKGEDLFSIRANAYDLVLNGYELSSGSIRIHERDVQKQIFKLLNISEEDQQKKFGHMLEAFTYGAPPHGGFAPGIDRIVMILQNEPNIREVIAFPKTGEGRDLMMGSPAPITDKQLKELGIKLNK